jgi:hypothetical protein
MREDKVFRRSVLTLADEETLKEFLLPLLFLEPF